MTHQSIGEKQMFAETATALLVLLWAYAAFSKLLDFNLFVDQQYRVLGSSFLCNLIFRML